MVDHVERGEKSNRPSMSCDKRSATDVESCKEDEEIANLIESRSLFKWRFRPEQLALNVEDIDGDMVTFPKSMENGSGVESSATTEYSDRITKSLASNSSCLAEVRSVCEDVSEVIAMTRCLEKKCANTVKQHTASKLSRTLVALVETVRVLTSTIVRADAAVSGLRKAVTEDIVDGVAPPFIYAKHLRYGLEVPPLCGTCGSRVNEDDVSLPQQMISQFIYGGKFDVDPTENKPTTRRRSTNRQKKKAVA